MATKKTTKTTSNKKTKSKPRRKSSKPKRDLYQEVTDKIVAALEKGVTPWIRPWVSFWDRFDAFNPNMPFNATSKKNYKGVNTMLLFLSGYSDPRWYSYKQAEKKHGQVRRGEKGTMVVFFKMLFIDEEKDDGTKRTKRIPVLRHYNVFNHTQIEWEEGKEPKMPSAPKPVTETGESEIEYTAAAECVEKTGANIMHGGDRAYYNVTADYIQLPRRKQFDDEGAYWATSLHEVTHWTGAEQRLDRDFSGRFGDESYAAEELVAEMGAAFLCAQLGVQGTLRHAEYLDNWLKVLKGDKYAIFTAAREAQKASEYVLNGAQLPAADDSDENENSDDSGSETAKKAA
jgi:antirestriction protein ArdC